MESELIQSIIDRLNHSDFWVQKDEKTLFQTSSEINKSRINEPLTNVKYASSCMDTYCPI